MRARSRVSQVAIWGCSGDVTAVINRVKQLPAPCEQPRRRSDSGLAPDGCPDRLRRRIGDAMSGASEHTASLGRHLAVWRQAPVTHRAALPCAAGRMDAFLIPPTTRWRAPAAQQCRPEAAAAAAPPAGFRGVSAEQDSRFANKEKKLLKVCRCDSTSCDNRNSCWPRCHRGLHDSSLKLLSPAATRACRP